MHGGNLPDRRSVRHPQPEAVLHGTGKIHRNAEQPAAARSRVLGERRDLFDRRGATERRSDRHSPLRPHDHGGVERASGSLLLPGTRSVHLYRLPVVRHWHACGQDRPAVGDRRKPPPAEPSERRRSHSGVSQRSSHLGRHVQHDTVVRRANQVRPRVVRPGLLDVRATDPQPRPANGVLQHLHSGRSLTARALRPVAGIRPHLSFAEMGGPVGAAPRRRLRHQRRRKNGHQGTRGQIYDRVLDRRVCAGLQPASPGNRPPHVGGP